MTTSTTNFLASLLASSSTGGTTATPLAKGSNPFAIGAMESPQEKLRLILEEREKLEEQRMKVGASTGPIVPKSFMATNPPAAATMDSSKLQNQQNPLFATDNGNGTMGSQVEPAEDDLWKLLMSSSIDSFRRVPVNEMGL
ncbi:uncharacterized protein PITG_17392 [Phytophthora infestans T30-4]|uniref:Uncharacterized protein n=1 Tax=Phytophthora infestans (strain T30-4) TaxID=403677 RepID=D0NVY9_PHYIT|nr:uncharacterized protein PITG_17392 [Phytophthora infestans T30-4]EEY66825.1 conserved hypothetical protein [Phytophthora infestans T30-4]|eukprot:XP_002896712.1 conserved hypothetical protein [Phytophthora infestans T30-4]